MEARDLNIGDYVAYDHIIDGNPADIKRVDAQQAYNHFIAKKDQQIPRLRTLLQLNGAHLTDEYDGLVKLNAWFISNIKSSEGRFGPDTQIDPMWSNIIFDLHIFLSEIIIARTENVSWCFNINVPKNEISYQHPVLSGFSKIYTKGYYHNIGLALFNYATGILEQEFQVEDNFFNYLLESAVIEDIDIKEPAFDHSPFEV